MPGTGPAKGVCGRSEGVSQVAIGVSRAGQAAEAVNPGRVLAV
jgi:hypothetical protein